ncbi:hypothetical protein C6A86_018430 [Mycobacterium sp. ITM-2016-00316]|uniref:hypothetical protein n=1 Tax=Mycobacterium sp. ITM-2016-00316 TaxID=2099695 RepID=UPI001E3CB676|nr:hypothetical protein [Mycobacterium sp. ITM-2016-00316]WNG80219.1 hypothetical protein C6A86_018430 [Mycobacterium sp. ITM-2016-00316]
MTLAAVAALGTGVFFANVAQQPRLAAPPQPAVATAPAAVPPPSTAPGEPAAAPFGTREDFVTDIPVKTGILGLQISVTGETARAYACDNYGIETWLSGSSAGGLLNLSSADKTARLEGRHVGNTIVGKLTIAEKHWDFAAAPGDTDVF